MNAVAYTVGIPSIFVYGKLGEVSEAHNSLPTLRKELVCAAQARLGFLEIVRRKEARCRYPSWIGPCATKATILRPWLSLQLARPPLLGMGRAAKTKQNALKAVSILNFQKSDAELFDHWGF